MTNDSICIDRQTLEDTICDLSASKELLEREAQTIATRVTAIGQRIQSLQEKLDQSARGSNGKSRLRKGQGVEAILKVLNPEGGLGLSQAQISEKTGIPGATVYRTLNKNKDKFVMLVDNLWRKKV